MKRHPAAIGFVVTALLTAACATQALAQSAPTNPANLPDAVAEFVVANRILADQRVIEDGFGHLSFRSPTDPKRFRRCQFLWR